MARKTITLEQLDRLSVDDETGELFWDGKQVVTVMSLPWWVQAAIIGTFIFTGVAAIGTVAPLFIR